MLDISKLNNVKKRGDKIIAACPACRADGRDKKGTHLIIYPSEQYGCAANQGDDIHRKEIFAHAGIVTERTPEEKKEWARQQRKQEAIEKRRRRREKIDADITQQISDVLESKLAPYIDDCWRLELLDTSPIRFYEPDDTPKDLVQFLFNSSDVLWLGGQYDTGKPKHAANFKTCAEWVKCETLPTRVAAGTFKAGSISRCNNNVLTSPFIIIESDDLIGHKPTTPEGKERNKQLGAALIRYAQECLGLTLRAVIDTGNKSLHAWFDKPPESDLRAIKRMADGLRIDTGVIDNCQSSPLRMPHCIHEVTKQMARLLYLNPAS